jgi:DNA repair exonuclease SbcCD ATPase subunit
MVDALFSRNCLGNFTQIKIYRLFKGRNIMIIKSIKINNLQLIKSAEATFDKINIISGLNKDNPSESGNGSGKSTFVLRAILFALYGYIEEGLTLKDLIRFGEKECSVTLEITNNNENYRIIRKIPSELHIFLNDKEIQANTATIKQKFIDEQFGDVNFFRQYRCVDLKNGINVLDLGIVSLRKTLMGFIEGIFTEIRTRLLAKKVERERYSVDKKLYKHYLSTKRLDILNASLDEIKKEYQKLEIEKDKQNGIINQIRSEISSRDKIIYYKEQDKKKLNGGMCPILSTKCSQISGQLEKVDIIKNKEINILKEGIDNYKKQLESEEESIEYYNDSLTMLRNKEQKAREKLLRLKGAFQFKDYKYTKADIVIYDEAVKVLDSFAGEYIKEWLSSLSIILNNLLNKLNIRIEFTADKDFIRVFDNEQILKYDQLSTGQRCFLGTVFKLSILLQQNKSGIILLDDGLNNLDQINFKNLIEIAKVLPFQLIAVYQNYNQEIQDVKQFIVTREKGVSKID